MCNDFEEIDDTILSNFKNLRDLCLLRNGIVINTLTTDTDTTNHDTNEEKKLDVRHKIEALKDFPCLSDLKLCYNNITRWPQANLFRSLSYINIEYNDIKTGEILVDLHDCLTLTSLRILKNPISELNSTRHVRNVCVGEIRSLKILNGTNLTKYDRRDFEIYYLRWTFQEFFRVHDLTQDTYLEEDFNKWAITSHPNAIKFVKEYENPYPTMKDRVLTEKMEENKPTYYKQYLNLFFTPYFGPSFGKKLKKTFAANTDLLYIRSWASYCFNISDMSAVDIKFKVKESDNYEKIEENEMTKT